MHDNDMSPTQRILQRIFTVVTWRPLLTIVVALALAGLSVLYTARNLDFLTSQKSLISSENRLIQLSSQLDQFDDLDNFVVVIQNENPLRTRSFLHALAARLEADREHYLQVFYRVDPAALKPWALFYLDSKDLLSLRNALEENRAFVRNLARAPDVTGLFKLLNAEISSEMVGELFTGFLDEKPSRSEGKPFDLQLLVDSLKSMDQYLDRGVYTSPWAPFFTGETWDEESEGYFTTENKRYLLLFVTPVKADEGFGKAENALDALRQAIADVRAGFPDVKAGVTGQEALNVDETMLAMGDMSIATLLSLLGLSVLLVVFWRGSRRPLFGITELLVALCLTFGLTTLVVGHLNILSVVFAPLLLGLGIDYGTHWLSRYQEEVQKEGVSRREAVRTTMVQLGPGLISAGLSASLSFFPLVLTGFRGLAELGIICAMGMLMTTTTSVCLLPAITLVFDRQTRRTFSPRYSPSKPLFRLTDGRALAIVICSGVGLVLSSILAFGVTFDLNMLRLQSKKAESVIWEMKILSESKRSSMYGAVLAHSMEEVERKAKALEALPSVSEVQSVATLLPHDQEQKLGLMQQLEPLLPEARTIRNPGEPVNLPELKNVLSRISFKMLDPDRSETDVPSHTQEQMEQVRSLIGRLWQRFESGNAAELRAALAGFSTAIMGDLADKLDVLHSSADKTRPMELTDLPETLLQRFIGENHLYLLRIFPADNIWEPEVLGRFVRDLRSVDPDAIGDPVTLYTFTKAFRDACMQAVVYALIFIVVVLLFAFRSVAYALLAMVPLFVGTAWTMGLIYCFGINLNLANSVFLPMIIGAGVEYAIIILQRWKQGGNGEIVLPFSTGKGVILAGLTTTVGFASLMISGHQGIHSLGLLTTIGSLCVLAAAVLLLPAIMHLLPLLSGRWAPKEMLVLVPEAVDSVVPKEHKQV